MIKKKDHGHIILLIIIGFLGYVFAPISVEAGTVVFKNGLAEWQSSSCTQPSAPIFEHAAGKTDGSDTLNTNTSIYNAYSLSVEKYLQCITTEANADMKDGTIDARAQLASINAAWQQDLTKRQNEMARISGR